MSGQKEHDPIGQVVTDYTVIGKEFNGENRWVGADLELAVSGLGVYFVNVVTKQHNVNESLEEALENIDRPEGLLEEPTELEKRPPFVVNDRKITEEVLDRKFRDRVVEEDLALSMFYLRPETSTR